MAKEKRSFILALALAVIVIIALVPFLRVSELRSSEVVDSDSVENDFEVLPGEFEPIVDPSLMDASENPTLGAAAACRMMDIVHRRQSPFYDISYTLDSKVSGQSTDGDVYRKIKRWKDPRAHQGVGNDVKIFCVLYTENGPGAKAIKDSWLGGCDDYLVVSRFPNPPEGIDKDHYYEVHVVMDTKPESMFPRLSQTFHRLATSKASQFDYFIYTTDDSYVVTENLRMTLNDPSVDALHRMGAPLYLGHRMVTSDDAPFTSNAMLIMNTHLMKIFRTILPDTRCYVTHQGGSEDMFFGKCLMAFRIFPLSIEDVFGQERLHILHVSGVANGGGGGWYSDFHRGLNPPKGLDAFSRSTFHLHAVALDAHSTIKSNIV